MDSSQTFSPGVLSLLPLFYVGWSDSVLSPTEMEAIHGRLETMDFLTESDKAYLIRHTDPRNPPSEAVFKEWLQVLRAEAHKLPADRKQTIAQLGLDIAKAGGHIGDNDAAVLKALTAIEQELGIYTQENLDMILHQLDAGHIQSAPKSATFDPARLQAILDGKRAAMLNKTRSLLKDPFFWTGTIRDKEEHRSRILTMTRALAQQGLGALAYPKAYGGQNDMGEYAAVFSVLASHDLSLTVKFGVQFGLFGGAIARLGTDEHHRLYLPRIGATELLGCFAMTETGHGSNVKDLETTATYNPDTRTFTIHTPHEGAGKEYIGNALHGSMAVVFAQLVVNGEQHGIHALLVPYRDASGQVLPGIRVADCGYKMGLNGVDNGRIWFDHVVVPRENLLNRYGDVDDAGQYSSPIKNPNKRFFTMLGALVGGRLCVGLGAVSAAKTALHIAIQYGLKRRQFSPRDGEPETILMDYPTHQHRLIPLLVKSYAYQMALTNLGEQYAVATEDDMRKIETKAAGLKAMATWHATHSIQTCREACGGKGYLTENRIGDLKADSDIFTTFEGDNTVLLQLVAKGLLTEFRQSFHDDGFGAVMRYLGSKISNTWAEMSPFASNTSLEQLLSDDFHGEALRYREKKMLISISDRMRDYLKKRLSAYDAFLQCQMHMIALAEAYTERLVWREMGKTIQQLPESPERIMLEKIRRYYALHTIDQAKGWYLETGYLEGSVTKTIRRILHKLTQELRPEVAALVTAWGIPESSVRAEIVWGNVH
ncbi:MAG: acyl-CoA dehydrogenase family protein [Chitinophagales bacterium]|nr:acyl-CoA dehydrogenase family protein [Chitinophagales bacterium]